MTQAHASDRADGGAVYETDVAAVSVRPRQVGEDRSVLEYAVETDHPAPVRVRIRQPISGSLSIDDLGFPGECADHWERDGDALLFDRKVAPSATVRTAWGVDGELGDGLEPPTIDAEPVSIELEDDFEIDQEAVDAAEGEEATADAEAAEDGEQTPDTAATESRSNPRATSDDEGAEEGEAVLDLDLAETDADDVPPAGTDSVDDADSVESPAELEDLETPPEDETFSIPETGDAASEDDPSAGSGSVADDEPAAPGDPSPDDAAGVPDGEPTTSEGPDEEGESETTSPSADSSGQETAPASDGDGAQVDRDTVVGQLVAELHDEAVDDSHRAALADALEVRLSDSTNAFVEHVRERQQRRAERIEDDLEALEDSLDDLYGLKADANEVATLKRAITRLDDAKATDDDLRDLRTRVQDLAEASADETDLEALREDHEALAASLDATDDELASLEEAAATDREAIRDEVTELADDLEGLEQRAATEERVDTVADDLATLRDAAATEAALDELEASLRTLEDEAATESELEAVEAELESVESRLGERIDLLKGRHDELAAEAATDAALESLREDHRARLNETKSELQALRETLEDEYMTDEDLSETLDRRVHRSLAHLVAFGIGAVGLVSTVPLAIAGSPAAAVTFLGGAGTLGAWWRAVGPAGVEGGDETGSLLDHLR